MAWRYKEVHLWTVRTDSVVATGKRPVAELSQDQVPHVPCLMVEDRDPHSELDVGGRVERRGVERSRMSAGFAH